MKKFIDPHKVYVKNNNGLIYKVESVEAFDSCDYLQIGLALVTGWDYVNPDENDIQGWCPAKNFVDNVQDDFVNQYFFVESMNEALEENGYTVLDDIPEELKTINN